MKQLRKQRVFNISGKNFMFLEMAKKMKREQKENSNRRNGQGLSIPTELAASIF